MKKTLIYLIGMPASGKSTFGQLLVDKIGTEKPYHFLDLDKLIEEQSRMTIPHIFREYGEDIFREKEQKALQTTFNLEKTIIATGGGTPCFFDNLEKMKEHGMVCFLDVEIEILAKRTFKTQQEQNDNRPLFKDAASFEQLYKLISQKWNDRKEFYQKAHFEVKNNDLEAFLEKLENIKI